MKPTMTIGWALLLLIWVGQAQAQGVFTNQGDQLLIQTSLWTKHYSNDPEHNNHQRMLNIEWYLPELDTETIQRPAGADWRDEIRWLVGGASFENSFGQRSTLLYVGGRYDFQRTDTFATYAKVGAGLLHGYRGEYRDKIPFNRFGVAPAVLPAFGIEYQRLNLEMIPFGTAGVMFNAGYYFR